jgi:hypothetical protein
MSTTRSPRIGVAVLGLVIVIVGLGLRAFQAEYSSGLNFMIESDGSAVHTVYVVDELNRDVDGNPSLTAVFQGTEAEALAYTEQRRTEEANLTVPWLITGVGALVLGLSVISASFPRKAAEVQA